MDEAIRNRIWIFDSEVFFADWMFVFKHKVSKRYVKIHNDCYSIRDFLNKNSPLLGGFNNKHYDQWILKAALAGWEPEEIKMLSDEIINGAEGWDLFHDRVPWFDQYDLMDDCAQGLSLKAIEANLGMNICESSVPFDIDRPLTTEEIEESFAYCTYDVDCTDILDDLRQPYLENKIVLAQECGMKPEKGLYMTNAKLTASYLHAVPREYNDERDYKYPANLRRDYIPQEVFDFIDRLHDPSLSREEVFGDGKTETGVTVNIGDCAIKIAFGGIHGAIPCYSETTTDTRFIRNMDVGSYYPHLMVVNGYCSRSIPHPDEYKAMLERRMKAKKAGDKVTANALKLVANTTYGAMLNQYNPLYDAKAGRSVCLSGQLYLLELAEHLTAECPTLKVIQVNTDGIMVSFDACDEAKWYEITDEWQLRTKFTLEEDRIGKIIQKDVSNYVEIAEDGSLKIKGVELVRGIAPAGAFNINNNAVIIADALREYLAYGTPIEETILGCDDTSKFQIIAKASGKYGACMHRVGDDLVPVQKCNRVYAGTDYRLGSVFKKNLRSGNYDKISSIPFCCVVDNEGTADISVVDKEWYIRRCQEKVDAFLGTPKLKRNTRAVNAIANRLLSNL